MWPQGGLETQGGQGGGQGEPAAAMDPASERGSGAPRRTGGATAPIPPLDRGEIHHPNAHEHQQQGGQAGQEAAEGEVWQGHRIRGRCCCPHCGPRPPWRSKS
jgi:hypothetical protein